MQIVIKLDAAEVQRRLGDMVRHLQDIAPALAEAGETVRTSVERNFIAEGRPQKWKPSRRAAKTGGQTLSDTGRLRNSFSVEADSRKVSIGTSVSYAAAHQLGAKIGARVILPVKGKALFWPGARHPVKKVNWPGATIPARPFLVIQDEDWVEIRAAMAEHIMRG
jgi:phage gpG-like protein